MRYGRSNACAVLTAALLAGCGTEPVRNGAAETPTTTEASQNVPQQRENVQQQTDRSDGRGEEQPDAKAPEQGNISECLKQDGERIAEMPLHAVGTEPFWAADVKGRCVTYSHPENQDGTRVWTQFSGTAENGTWSGYLGDQKFVMKTRPQPGCSDGMSDKRYPIAVTLTVRGEERSGCAERR